MDRYRDMDSLIGDGRQVCLRTWAVQKCKTCGGDITMAQIRCCLDLEKIEFPYLNLGLMFRMVHTSPQLLIRFIIAYPLPDIVGDQFALLLCIIQSFTSSVL